MILMLLMRAFGFLVLDLASRTAMGERTAADNPQQGCHPQDQEIG